MIDNAKRRNHSPIENDWSQQQGCEPCLFESSVQILRSKRHMTPPTDTDLRVRMAAILFPAAASRRIQCHQACLCVLYVSAFICICACVLCRSMRATQLGFWRLPVHSGGPRVVRSRPECRTRALLCLFLVERRRERCRDGRLLVRDKRCKQLNSKVSVLSIGPPGRLLPLRGQEGTSLENCSTD